MMHPKNSTTWLIHIIKGSIKEDLFDTIREKLFLKAKVGDPILGIISIKIDNPSISPSNQGPNLYERTTKLEDTLTQFMQVSLSNHKSTELAIKKLEVQVGQLPKQLDERPIGSFVAYTKKNPKEEYKAVLTRSHRRENIKREERDE